MIQLGDNTYVFPMGCERSLLSFVELAAFQVIASHFGEHESGTLRSFFMGSPPFLSAIHSPFGSIWMALRLRIHFFLYKS